MNTETSFKIINKLKKNQLFFRSPYNLVATLNRSNYTPLRSFIEIWDYQFFTVLSYTDLKKAEIRCEGKKSEIILVNFSCSVGYADFLEKLFNQDNLNNLKYKYESISIN